MEVQEVRRALVNAGFTPMVRICNAEHFVRDSKMVTVFWEGAHPEKAQIKGTEGFTAIASEDGVRISLKKRRSSHPEFLK